jgi:cystathionine beta-synthase
VIEAMRHHGISQMPVISADRKAEGMIHEYDLLNALIAGTHKLTDPIDPIVAPLQGVITPEISIAQLREVFAQDNVAVVKDGQDVVAILTKIDLIEHLAARMASST